MKKNLIQIKQTKLSPRKTSENAFYSVFFSGRFFPSPNAIRTSCVFFSDCQHRSDNGYGRQVRNPTAHQHKPRPSTAPMLAWLPSPPLLLPLAGSQRVSSSSSPVSTVMALHPVAAAGGGADNVLPETVVAAALAALDEE